MSLVGDGIVGLGGDGAGFQLFTQSNNDPGIYADAADRDVYFAANPADLTRLDENEFLIIKLLDNGSGEIAYQQRQNSVFVDVTSLVQGEQGTPGDSGNSNFYEDIAARNTFFSANPGSLKTDLPVMVNEDGIVTNYIWTGPDAPVVYDAELFRPGSLGARAGSLVMGHNGGYTISSGGHYLDHKDAFQSNAYTPLIRHDLSGSTPAETHELSPANTFIYAAVQTDLLTDPQTLFFEPDSDKLVHQFSVVPATPGQLRFQIFAGELETDPVLIDKTFTIELFDLGFLFPLTTDNQLMLFKGDKTLIKISGVQMNGGLQTVGPYDTQTVFAFRTLEHIASKVEFPVFGLEQTTTAPDGSTQATASIKNGFSFNVETLKLSQTGLLEATNTFPISMFWADEGRLLFTLSPGTGLYKYTASTPFDSSTLSFVNSVTISQDSSVSGLWISRDGAKAFIGGNNTNRVYEFDMSISFDTTTLVFAESSLAIAPATDIRDMAVSTDAKRLFIVSVDDKVFDFTLQVRGTLVQSSYSGVELDISADFTDPVGLAFSPDGYNLYLADFGHQYISQYEMSEPWNISTGLPVGISDVFGFQNIRSLVWEPSARKFYFVDRPSRTVFEFDAGLSVGGRIQGDFNPVKLVEYADQTTQGTSGLAPDTNMSALAMKKGQTSALTGVSTPTGVTLTPDGRRMITQSASGIVNGFNLITPWDSSTLVADGSITLPESTQAQSGFILPDQTKYFMIDLSADRILEYNFGTPGDVTTLVFSENQLSVNSEDVAPRQLYLSGNLDKLYMIGQGAVVFQYDLNNSGSLIGASYSGKFFNVSSQSSTPVALGFSADGRHMYVGDFNDDTIIHWRLSTAWEVDTAVLVDESDNFGPSNIRGFAIKPDGTRAIYTDASDNTVTNIDFGIDIKGKIIGEVEVADSDLITFEDETTLISGSQSSAFKWSASTVKRGDTFNIPGPFTAPTGSIVSQDGKLMIVSQGDNVLSSYNLGVPWDVTTAVVSNSFAIAEDASLSLGGLSLDKSKLIILGRTADVMYEYSMTTPGDISTLVYTGISFNPGAQEPNTTALRMSLDGTKIFLHGSLETVFQYNAPTPYSLAGLSYSGKSINVNPEAPALTAIGFTTDGRRLFTYDFTGPHFGHYLLSDPWDLDVVTFVENSQGFTGDNLRGLDFSPDGSRIIAVNQNGSLLSNYELGISTKGKILGDVEIPVQDPLLFANGTTQITAGQPNDDHWYAATMKLGAVTAVLGASAPNGISITPDGKTMVLVNSNGPIDGYTLTTPWDSSTLVLDNSSTLSGANFISGFLFPDLTRFFILQGTLDVVQAYDFSVPGDVTTLTLATDVLSVSSEDITTRALSVKTDLKMLYYLGGANNTVYQYSLPNAGSLDGAFYTGKSFSVSAQASVPISMGFSPDGNHMFIGDFSNDEIYHYRLDTPWEIDTARFIDQSDVFPSINLRGFSMNADGTRMIMADNANSTVTNIDLGINVKGKILGVDSIFGVEDQITFPDGSNQNTSATEDKFKFQISTIEEANVENLDAGNTSPVGFYFGDFGRKLYVQSFSTDLFQYDLSVPYDTTTMVFNTSIPVIEDAQTQGLWVSNDGRTVFINGAVNDAVFQYEMTTPFSISTLVYTGISLLISAEEVSPRGIVVSGDGKKLFIMGNLAIIFQYDLPQANSLLGASYTGISFDLDPPLPVPVGFGMLPSGKSFYVAENTGGVLYQYDMDVPFDITTARSIGTRTDLGFTGIRGFQWSPSGHKFFALEFSDKTFHEYNGGIDVPGKIVGASTFNGPDTFEIHSVEKWEALAVAGVITIAADTTIKILADFETTIVLALTGGNLLITGDNDEVSTIRYTGSGTFVTITGDHVFRARARVVLLSSGPGAFMAFTGETTLSGGLDLIDTTLLGWGDLGTIVRGFLSLTNTNLIAYSAPFKLTDSFATGTVSSVFGGVALEFNWSDPNYSQDTTISLNGFSSFVALTRVSPFIPQNVRVLVPVGTTGSSNVAIFDTAGGSTGTYTAVADGGVVLTLINNVTNDGSGDAAFFAAILPKVGQIVTLSGFIINTAYNGTFRVSLVIGGVEFVVEDLSTGVRLLFGTSEDNVGSFEADGIEISSVAHGLPNGDKLQLSSDLSTRYDGGYEIYDVQTNTFSVNTTFVDTQTGTWDTSPIDQTNPNVLAFEVVDNPSSHYIACGHVNDNSTVNGAIVNNTFTAMVFGTVGNALQQSTTTERWKLVDEIAGVFEYTGNEPFDNSISFDFTVTSTGGTVDFRFKWEIDTGSGFGNLPDDVEALVAVGSDAQGVTKKFPLKAVKGDQIRPRITRNSGGSGITTSYATIFAGA